MSEFQCLTCHKPIKISKIDNHALGQKKKGERFELDGVTPHQYPKKKEEQAPVVSAAFDNGPQIAAPGEQMKELKETVNILISQVQGLRSKFKTTK